MKKTPTQQMKILTKHFSENQKNMYEEISSIKENHTTDIHGEKEKKQKKIKIELAEARNKLRGGKEKKNTTFTNNNSKKKKKVEETSMSRQ